MFPVRYELGFYIPEDGILHSHRREYLKSYIQGFIRAIANSERECYNDEFHTSYESWLFLS
jgi:hypothetical protein